MHSELADVRRHVGGPFEEVNRRVLQQTTSLLGATIGFSAEDWAEPVCTLAWTRAHVAAHLVADATRIRHLATALTTGQPIEALPSSVAAHDELDAMSASGPLDLQIALDTSAGLAAQALHDLPPALWDVPVELPGVQTIAGMLPLARLSEVVSHHLDLSASFNLSSVDHETLAWCLSWRAALLADDQDFPAVRLVSPGIIDQRIGGAGEPVVAQADPATLLGWLCGRDPAGAPWAVR